MVVPASRVAVVVLVVSWTLRLLERSGRIRALTNPSRRSLWTDLVYLFLAPVSELFSRLVMILALVAAAAIGGRGFRPELLSGFGAVVRQPRWLMVLELIVFADFVYYWVHRLAHTVPALWRFHAVHHSSEHLRWTSALRAHPVETYCHAVIALPLFLLGFPFDALVAVLGLSGLYSFVIHANVNVSSRRLSYVLNSPRYHAWHHARDARDGTVNFAGFFPFFDALFGTYKHPDRLPPAFGLDDPATPSVPEDFLGQLKYPFLGADVGGEVQGHVPRRNLHA
ncbi:MAG TPA: sterol desaturase family protein [Polyangiaceae bacterium]|nr:sterol desaturase family protein [Polyangiaceae bacterium]